MNFKEYQEKAASTAIYPSSAKVFYPALGLAGEVGEVCNKIKKVYRDKSGEFSHDTRQELSKELGDCFWYLAALAEDLGLCMNTIAAQNIEKLLSRKERGVLGGSGDNR